MTSLWGGDSVSNHQPHDCLLNRSFRCRSKRTSKLRVTGLCAGNSPGTGEFPAQMASYTENVSIWWRHHDIKSSNTDSIVSWPDGQYDMVNKTSLTLQKGIQCYTVGVGVAIVPWQLTHWDRNKMAAIFQTFSNVISWIKIFEFRLTFHWSLFLRVELTILQH